MDPQFLPQQSVFVWRRLLDTPPEKALWLPVAFAFLVIFLLGMFRRENRWRGLLVPSIIVGILSALYVVAGQRVFLGLFSWYYLLVPVFAIALLYVGLMYRKDARSVHPAIAGFLGLLRCCVYAVLAAVFLLPGCQTFDRTEYHSKVLFLFDVSGSMVATVDDLPEVGQDPATLPTRQDKVVRFLTEGAKESKPFADNVLAKSPVTAYRFGSLLDETEILNWKEGQGPTADATRTWLKPDRRHFKAPDGVAEDEVAKLRVKYQDQVESLLAGTNIGGSALQMVKLEANSLLQAVVVFSDGQNNLGSDEALRDFVNRLSGARKKGVPIFTVGVGEYRLPASIRIDDLQAPETARPDDKFPIRVPVVGSGLVDQEFTVTLEARRVKDAAGQPVVGEKTHILDPKRGKFQGAGDYPQDVVEFEIDVQDMKGKRADEDTEGELEGTWQFVAKVPRHSREAFAKAEHITDPPTEVLVQKRKLRVLLFAGGPTKEYQFLRTLLFREVQEKRLELSVFLQTAREDNVDQDVESERLLHAFPHKLGPTEATEKHQSLSDYDVIVAIDPDWLALDPDQMKLLKEWVGTHAGGIVFVAGPVHTYQLVRPAGVDITALKTLLPVHLNDSRLHGLGGIGHDTTRPYVLNFTGAAKLYDFLKLDETGESAVEGWSRFFWGPNGQPDDRTAKPTRGIFNYYPVDKIKADSAVLATFNGPESSRINDGKDEQPFMVAMRYGNGKTFYLGSAETWRLRQTKDSFHERFWIKLCRYLSAGTTQQKKYGRILLARTAPVGNINFEAQLKGSDLLPLAADLRPAVHVKRLDPQGEGAPKKDETFDLKAKTSQGDWAGWFAGTFRVKEPGEYEFRIPIPGTGESLTQRLTVRKPNPELDNVRNNFGLLQQLASEAGPLLTTLPADTRRKVQSILQPRRLDDSVADKEPTRLFFKLDQAGAIADCLVQVKPQEMSVKGKLFDLWDDGWKSGITASAYHLAWGTPMVVGLLGAVILLIFRQFLFAGLFIGAGALMALGVVIVDKSVELSWQELPVNFSFVLVGIVTLLGLEWLLRKLLKLA